MQILYDMQNSFADTEVGAFIKSGPISARMTPISMAKTEIVEGIWTILVYDRDSFESGLDINLPAIEGLQEGDRLTVTGRVKDGHTYGTTWGIALLGAGDRNIAQFNAPQPVFSLSHILEGKDLDKVLFVHTLGWGSIHPTMDFNVDSVLITRREESEYMEVDTRTVVYSFAEATDLQKINIDSEYSHDNPYLIIRSGEPIIRLYKRGEYNALHVGNRVRDYDGVDINIVRMGLRTSNKYEVIVKGKIDGEVPIGSTIMLQGIPSYAWQSPIPISDDMEFTLRHTLKATEIEKWTTVRITTNTPGSSVSFFIYGIEIIRL